MNRTQTYVSLLLERLPKWELRSYDNQTILDKIRDKISNSDNLKEELEFLYKVNGFSQFALALMWIVNNVEKDTTKEESTLAEETLVFERFREAVGEKTENTETEENKPSESLPEEQKPELTLKLPSLRGFESAPPPTISIPEPLFDIPKAPTPEILETWGATPIQDEQVSFENNGEQESKFAKLLEQFLESIQSGNDDRNTLLNDLLNQSKAIINVTSLSDDMKKLCTLFAEFLQYISDNQFIDDVRAMNIVSNVQDPVSQWVRSGKDERSGILEPAIEILNDYKTMFE